MTFHPNLPGQIMVGKVLTLPTSQLMVSLDNIFQALLPLQKKLVFAVIGICIKAFFLTPDPWPSYSATSGAVSGTPTTPHLLQSLNTTTYIRKTQI